MKCFPSPFWNLISVEALIDVVELGKGLTVLGSGSFVHVWTLDNAVIEGCDTF